GRQCQGRPRRSAGQTGLLRRPEQPCSGARDLHEAPRCRQSRPRDLGICYHQVVPALPVMIQHNKLFFGLFALDANGEFHYPKYFSMLVFGPEPLKTFSKGYFELAMAQTPKPKTLAIVAADAKFAKKASDGARDNAEAAGLKAVYDR